MQVAVAQLNCPTPGKTPGGAIPFCGDVTEPAVNYICYNRELVVPKPDCPGVTINGIPVYRDVNPNWYKFSCYQSGTLGFTITPSDLNADYNWQLYDVTGTVVTNLYTNINLTKGGNWSGAPGLTGASSAGQSVFECYAKAAEDAPRFSKMPFLIAGHNYLLLVSRFAGSGGFNLSVTEGTADIVDPLNPHMVSASAICTGSPLTVVFNKKLKCIRPYNDLSEFVLSPPLATITGGAAVDCLRSETIDSVIFYLSNPLPPGTYMISVKEPRNITDFCGRKLPEGETVIFTLSPPVNTAMDSIKITPCATDEIQLVFKNKIACNSLASDGTDFIVTGPGPVTVESVLGKCAFDPSFNSFTNVIHVKLSETISIPGNYQVKLVTGSDGNTLKDICGWEIPSGSSLNFYVKEPVFADFNYTIGYGCIKDTIKYVHDGMHHVNIWKWNFDGIAGSSQQNPQILYDPFGRKSAQLIVSNGNCSDTSDVVFIDLGNELKPAFEVNNTICPGQPAVFKNNSSGDIVSFLWEFGNGNTSILESPPRQYYPTSASGTDVIAKLSVADNMGCINTAAQKISLANNCDLLVPGAFTPDGNGINDYLGPVNLNSITGYYFRVFNRYGETVFETTDPSKKWDGTYKGKKAGTGTYLWVLRCTDYAGRIIDEKGTCILLR